MPIDIASLEHATLDAVAPTTVEAIAGWMLPFDRSTVGRAISAVPLQHQAIHADDICSIESRYVAHGLQAQFRIADVEGLAELQQRLVARGYFAQQPTLTMVASIQKWPAANPKWTVQLSARASDAWQSVYLAADFDPIDGANRVKALSRSTCATYAWIEDEQSCVAAGTAAMSQGWMSLHGLRTLARVRGQGCATALIGALCTRAQSEGLERCFLQVDETNAPAISLYRRLGFQTAWRYHYWRKAPQAAKIR